MRYAAGVKDVLDRTFNNKPLKKDDVIVEVCLTSFEHGHVIMLKPHVNIPNLKHKHVHWGLVSQCKLLTSATL